MPYLDDQGKVLGSTFSSFYLNLKEKPWLPALSAENTSRPLQCCPRHVFMPKPEVVRLLGDHALYSIPSLVNENFLKDLGIQTSVNFDTLLAEFVKWIAENPENEDGGFVTSLSHLTNVYQFIENHATNHEDKRKYFEDVTRNKPVIFVPIISDDKASPTDENLSRSIRGTFLSQKRVYWSDPSNLIQTYQEKIFADPRRMLRGYYPTLESVFVNFLRIDQSPNLKEYLQLLERIASQSSMASGPIVDDMMKVYDVIATKCMAQDSTRFVKGQLLSLSVFPTTEEKWVSLKEKPLFCDDKSLAKLFENAAGSLQQDGEGSHAKSTEEKVHFIKMGLQPTHVHRKAKRNEEFSKNEDNKSRIRKSVSTFFKDVCEIQNLSECVSSEVIPTLASKCPALQSFLSSYIPYIQLYIYTKHPDQHDQHQEAGMAAALANVKCFSANELEVVYRLSTHPSVMVSKKKACGVENKNNLTFYVTDGELKDKKHIIKELAQFFVRPENVGNFSNYLQVLTQLLEDGIENYVESQGLDPLPDDVTQWIVPEPPPTQSQMMVTVEESDELLSPIDSTISQKPERQAEVSETDGEQSGLRSWPPRAPGTPHVVEGIGKNTETEAGATSWPPPAPPEGYASHTVKATTPAVGAWQPEQQKHTENMSNGSIDHENQAGKDSSEDEKSSSAGVLRPAALQMIQCQPNTSEFNSNVSTTDPHQAPNPPANPSQADFTRQPSLPNICPPELSDVRVEVEDVDLGAGLEGTEIMSLPQSANAEEIGRWGEEFVYTLLKNNETVNQVIWVNEREESGLPYDVVIKRKDGQHFVEIKSTSTSGKHALEISSQEIKCAFEKQENYHLYRVYNAGNANDCRVSRVCNLASHLDKKAVSLFILI